MENVLSKKGTNMKGKQVDFLYSLLFFCVHVCHMCATPQARQKWVWGFMELSQSDLS